jgi:hypothetical protein
MYRSRWGFHPCDYSTFRKLKFLHHVYLTAIRMARCWQRWKRKDPHNRVIRRRLRDAQGQVIGFSEPVPQPEPMLCPVFAHKVLVKQHVDRKGTVFPEGFLEEKVVTESFDIPANYAAARKPAQDEAEVRAIRISAETIDALFEQAQSWLAAEAVR